MAENTLKTRIFLRSDILEHWEQANPVLGKGEAAVVYDPTIEGTRSILMKVGDGITPFKLLPYIGISNEEREKIEQAIAELHELKKIENADGSKSEIFNERDGGGVKYTDEYGAASYVGTHDNIGGEPGVQIYVDKDATGNESTIIDVTEKGAYYTKGEVKPGAERDVPENEIATVGVVNAETTRAEQAEAILQNAINDEASARAEADSALSTRIEALEARGRFLSSWDATTGKPETEPEVLPYTYKSGDYFIVSVVASLDGQKNYRPDGSEYTGAASTVEETEELGASDYYTYDGAKWVLVPNAQKTVTFKQLAGQPRENEALKAELEKIETEKLNVLGNVDDPSDPGYGWPYHIPYDAIFEPDADKLKLTLKTITLDNNKTKMSFDKELPSATESYAGLMSAADKVALDKVADTWEKGEGLHSVVQVNDALAPGSKNIAQGNYSVAEGYGSMTIVDEATGRRGDYAHAEGYMTTALGAGSHAEGENTITNNEAEHAQGRGNISHSVDGAAFGNEKNTLSSIGIGALEGTIGVNRQNAAEIMQNGDAYLLGIGGYTGKEDVAGLDNVSTVQEVVNNKLNVLPLVDDPEDPGFGWEYHIPYRFDFTPDAEKIALKLHTLTLDNKFTKMTFDSAIPGASQETAGLMTAADKAKLESVVDVDAKTLEILPVSAYGFDTNLRVQQVVSGSALIDKVLEATNVDKKQVIIKSGDYKYNVVSMLQPDVDQYKGFAVETMFIDPTKPLEGQEPKIEKGAFLYIPEIGQTVTFYGTEYTSKEIDNIVNEMVLALNKKVDKELIGTNGTAQIFNETDGGGAKFVNNDGTESFVGVNDGGANGIAAQIYADKLVDGKWQGAKLDVTNGGIYYTVGNQPASERDVEANELATKGDIKAAGLEAGDGIDENQLKENQTIALDLSKIIIDGGSATDWTD